MAVGHDEGGWFECVATNYLGRDSRLVRVDVLGPPTVRRMSPVDFVLRHDVNEDLVLRCPYSGYPIKDIRWTKAGERLPTNERQNLFSNNGSLVVKSVSATSDGGEYACIVSDGDGKTARAVVHVKIRGTA